MYDNNMYDRVYNGGGREGRGREDGAFKHFKGLPKPIKMSQYIYDLSSYSKMRSLEES